MVEEGKIKAVCKVCKEPLRFERDGIRYTIAFPDDVCYPLVKLVEEKMGRLVLTVEEYEKRTGSKLEAEKTTAAKPETKANPDE